MPCHMLSQIAAACSGGVAAILLLPVSAPAADYRLAGVALGTPAADAVKTLRERNPRLTVVPDSLEIAGATWTYGLTAVGGGEGFYCLLALPPSEPTVTKLTWVAHFAGQPPRQDDLVAKLATRYGAPSYDTLPASLSLGSRELFWVDDEAGHRIHGGDAFNKCRGQSTFFMNGPAAGDHRRYDPTNVRLPSGSARLRLEQGYVNATDRLGAECGGFTMIRARLFGARAMGVAVPNLVEYLVLMLASGPLDRDATNATHRQLIQSLKSK